MKTREHDLLWFDVTVPTSEGLGTVARAIGRALKTELKEARHAKEDGPCLRADVMGMRVELFQIPQGYELRGSLSSASSEDSRRVSLSDFVCALLNAGEIQGWIVASLDRDDVEQRLTWDAGLQVDSP